MPVGGDNAFQSPVRLPVSENESTTYDPKSIEPKWQTYWASKETFKTSDTGREKVYVLDMFPYPSGSGLHIGHPLGYTATDIYSRYKRMKGFDVLHPMGWDAFGLPAEQHAVNTGEHPAIITAKNCQTFARQMKDLGFSYDWDREISTTNEDYYKWTQWIFVLLYNSYFDETAQKARPIEELPIPAEIAKQGEVAVQAYQAQHRLAYYADAMVNWCPALGTVLANEEVIDGKSERGGHDVVRKPMKQWMMRITKYSERLLSELEEVDWPEAIKEQQRNWIGRSEGVNFKQRIKDLNIEFEVYDSIPQTFLAQTFTVIAPDHVLVPTLVRGTDREKEVLEFVDYLKAKKLSRKYDFDQDMEGIFTGRYVDNPFGSGDLPIWIASYVVADYGTGIVNCSAHDERDFQFAKKYSIPLKIALLPEDPEQSEKVEKFEIFYREPNGILQSPAPAKGMRWYEGRQTVIDYIVDNRLGRRKVNYKLRDWLFSRQRYWGEPIPVIHWEDGTSTSLSPSELPLLLPKVEDYKPSEGGESPLAKATDWLYVTDPKTGKKGKRETNTMPQWAGSCWYYLRFIDPKNPGAAWDPALEKKWMPVDLYVGGAEHAVLHLLYSRFWHKVLYDLGKVSTKEPFKKLFNQGMIQSHAFKDTRGALVSVDLVKEESDGSFTHTQTGEKLERIVAKMSKSLKNVINPDAVVKQYGADTLRTYLMFMGPLEASRPWDSKAINGNHRFLRRAFTFVTGGAESGVRETVAVEVEAEENRRAIHKVVKKIGEDLEGLRFNTPISTMMEFLNTVGDKPVSRDTLEKFVAVLCPFAPHLAEELWERLGHTEAASLSPWPTFDPALVQDDVVTVVIQIGGKKRATVEVSPSIAEADLKAKVIEAMAGTAYKVGPGDRFITVFSTGTKIPRLVNVLPHS
jgi:leucyl-tRNA synthetase